MCVGVWVWVWVGMGWVGGWVGGGGASFCFRIKTSHYCTTAANFGLRPTAAAHPLKFIHHFERVYLCFVFTVFRSYLAEEHSGLTTSIQK